MHDEPFWVNFYQFRLFESIIQDMLAICPDAWYIQVANPVFAGITLLGRLYPEAKIVGVCHGFGGVYHLASKLGLSRDGLTFQIPGVNHFVWLTHLYDNGQDALPLIAQWIEKEAPAYWREGHISSDLGPKAVDLYRRFGVFPIGDTCTPGGGSWPYWYHTDDSTQARWQEDPDGWFADYFRHQQAYISQIQALAADPNARVTDSFPAQRSDEVMIPIIESIAFDIPRVIITNIPNRGEYVPGVPRDVAVEVPTLVSARGIQGIQTDGLPLPVLVYLLRDRVAHMEMELEAYLAGSREALLQLVLMDPYTAWEAQARALLDDILALPYHQEMRQHYR
jgi:alpha-galactosidase